MKAARQPKAPEATPAAFLVALRDKLKAIVKAEVPDKDLRPVVILRDRAKHRAAAAKSQKARYVPKKKS